MATMASVILLDKSGVAHEVETTADFNHRVYNLGWLPQTGTIEDNYETLLAGSAPTPTPSYIINESGNDGVGRIKVLTQADYNSLATKVPDTLYVIVG
jgi:hypothetical protein